MKKNVRFFRVLSMGVLVMLFSSSMNCPPGDEPVTFFPHQSDCTKYYRCIDGIPVAQNCPPGRHFNATLNTCDYPETAGCNSGCADIIVLHAYQDVVMLSNATSKWFDPGLGCKHKCNSTCQMQKSNFELKINIDFKILLIL